MKYTYKALFNALSPTTVLLMVILFIPACAHRKKNVEHYYAEAAKSAEAHNFPKAIEYANQAIMLQPSSRSFALKATVLYQNGKLQESKKTFEVALQQKNISPVTQTNILNNYAAVLARLGYNKRAQIIWQNLIKDKSYTTPEVAWFNLGILSWEESNRLKKKSPKRALRVAQAAVNLFSKAIAVEPAYVDAYFFKAQILVAYKKKKEAATLLKKVIALAPTHTRAQKMLRTLSGKK